MAFPGDPGSIPGSRRSPGEGNGRVEGTVVCISSASWARVFIKHRITCVDCAVISDCSKSWYGRQGREGRDSSGTPDLRLPRGKEKKEEREGAEDCELPRVDWSWPAAPSHAPCRALPADRKGEAARLPWTRSTGPFGKKPPASAGEGPGSPGSERTPENPSTDFGRGHRNGETNYWHRKPRNESSISG